MWAVSRGYCDKYPNVTSIKHCTNSGLIFGTDKVGGVAGAILNCRVSNCRNEGAVSGNQSVGGIIGFANWTKIADGNNIVKLCVNFAGISGAMEVGGIAGNQMLLPDVQTYSYYQCYNSGNVRCTYAPALEGRGMHSCAGGIVGRGSDFNHMTILECGNSGYIRGEGRFVGGIAGKLAADSPCENCYNVGNVYGLYECGGLSGYGGILLRCYVYASESNPEVEGKYGIDCALNNNSVAIVSNDTHALGITGAFNGNAARSYHRR